MPKPGDQHAEFRRCHLGGAVYLVIESVLWFAAATFAAAGRFPVAVVLLLFGGIAIHPVTAGLSRLLRLPTPAESNRLPILATWVALTIPLGLPLVFMATRDGGGELFFPAFAVLVGAHWLPFVYIYGMLSFVALAVLLVLCGILHAFVFAASTSACAFVVGGILLLFAVIHYLLLRREGRPEG